ncbi:MAG: acetylxylan esterase, partial [Opitutaceae bacterium]|nr:acetylxylan esterase [Opitutaceae bacterium]
MPKPGVVIKALAFGAQLAVILSGYVSNLSAAAKISVTPEHEDWIYALGEPIRFRVSVTDNGKALKDVAVTYTLGLEKIATSAKNSTIPEEGFVFDAGALASPGFLRCIVNARIAGKPCRGIATAAVEPEKIAPTQTEPGDFESFWENTKSELAKIPLEAERTLLPEYCTEIVNVYQVRIRTLATGPMAHRQEAHVYGILCEPKAPGKYPAVLRVPGAGVH